MLSEHTVRNRSRSSGVTPAVTPLFVPAHETRKVQKALGLDHCVLILDLEASVPPEQKDVARQAVNECLRELAPPAPEVWVRVHSAGPELEADIEQVAWAKVTGAVVAHAEHPDVLRQLEGVGIKRLMPLVESAAGLAALDRLADVTSVERFAIGTWDLALDLGLFAVSDPDESELIWQVRGDLVVASRRLGLAPPLDGVYVRLEDDAGFRKSCERVHRLGYGGKLLIHPRQLPIAQAVFDTDDRDLQWAREIVDRYEAALLAGHGAIKIGGQMIDRPMFERARLLLAAQRTPSPFPHQRGSGLDKPVAHRIDCE